MILNLRCCIILALLTCSALALHAQTSLRKIQVTEEGIYKIEASQIDQISSNFSEIGLFGYPGSLPQKLSVENLDLQQIPIWEFEDAIYFYIAGPNRWEWSGEEWIQEVHQGTDTLTYYVGLTETPKRIQSLELPNQSGPESTVYTWETIRIQETNVLNSGRDWYGAAIASGDTRSYTIDRSTSNESPWLIKGSLMAQSLSSSEMSVSINSVEISQLSFNPIPDAIYGVKGRIQKLKDFFTPENQEIGQIEVGYTASAPNSSGYVEFLSLGIPGASFNLGDGIWYSITESAFSIKNPRETEIWNIEDFFAPKRISIDSEASIQALKIAVFEPANAPSLILGDPVEPFLQNGNFSSDLLIITHPTLLSAANKLAGHKSQLGIQAEVVTIDEVFEAYSYGNRDVVGIRNFIADRYQNGQRLKNVLLFGKGTFDGKSILGGRPNLVPIYTSRESLNPLATFSSDDFYGLIDFGQGEWEENREGDEILQIGIGRLPVISATEASTIVDKIIEYESKPVPGDWKRTVAFFADDADNNIHVRDAEAHSEYLYQNHRSYFQDKLYLDRYEQTNAGSGQNSPQAKDALKQTLDRGTLLLNYIGHGNETTLTAEEVFQVEDIRDWSEQDKLALWVTATCEFGRHDSPFVRSAAEELLIAAKKGAIGLLTTGRPVFSSVNFRLNEAFIEEVFATSNGENQDLGTIFRKTKNGSLNGALNRNFSLLGDPSMKLADPDLGIEITSLKNAKTEMETDTLSAFREIALEANVVDPLTGAVQSNFDGDFLLDIRDKPVLTETLGDESAPFEFQEEKVLLFRGSGKISSGSLSASFLVSSNINYDFGDGALRILGTEEDGFTEAIGGMSPIIGGSDAPSLDTEGPLIFALFEGIANPVQPFPSSQINVDLSLEDISGINVSGINPGQEIQIQVNNGTPQILNSFFLATDGAFQKGKLTTSITGLKEGLNEILIRVWDNLGNSSTLIQNLEVSGSDHIQILAHKVYPNPASEKSNFEIIHNRPDENLLLELAVYNAAGSILFSESQRLVGVSRSLEDIKWIFLQRQTKYPPKGTYIYKLSLVSLTDNTKASVSGKIIIE